MEAGMCRTCNGLGEVHDPDYDPSKHVESAPSSSSGCFGLVLLLIAIPVTVLLIRLFA